jgi:hypothetical protein
MQDLICELVCRALIEEHIEDLKVQTLYALNCSTIDIWDHVDDAIEEIVKGGDRTSLCKLYEAGGVHFYSRTVFRSYTEYVIRACYPSKRVYMALQGSLTRLKYIYGHMRWVSLRSGIVFMPNDTEYNRSVGDCEIVIYYDEKTLSYKYGGDYCSVDHTHRYNNSPHYCLSNAGGCAFTLPDSYLKAIGTGEYVYTTTFDDDVPLKFYLRGKRHQYVSNVWSFDCELCKYIGDDLIIVCRDSGMCHCNVCI